MRAHSADRKPHMTDHSPSSSPAGRPATGRPATGRPATDRPATDPALDPLAVVRLTDPDQLRSLLQREPVNPVDGLDGTDGSDGLGQTRAEILDRALAARTGVNRRVFALVRPDDQTRVRTVVWVALTSGVPTSLNQITAPDLSTPTGPLDTAVFWSIWNDDTDVTGRGRGGDLILGAAEHLRAELSTLTTFVTLSPAPGLREHLQHRGPQSDEPIAVAAARYLSTLGPSGSPIDPVARFHMGNGARLWRVVPDADPSERGMARSYGLLVNYRYAPEDLAANKAQLAQGAPALGDEIAALLH